MCVRVVDTITPYNSSISLSCLSCPHHPNLARHRSCLPKITFVCQYVSKIFLLNIPCSCYFIYLLYIQQLYILFTPNCPFCDEVDEDVEHLFVGCPRLQGVWECLLPSRAPSPSGIRDAAESVTACQSADDRGGTLLPLGPFGSSGRPGTVGCLTTSPVTPHPIIAQLEEHLKLWVCRAGREIDDDPLLSWCRSVAM
jgi:hypothetical protein